MEDPDKRVIEMHEKLVRLGACRTREIETSSAASGKNRERLMNDPGSRQSKQVGEEARSRQSVASDKAFGPNAAGRSETLKPRISNKRQFQPTTPPRQPRPATHADLARSPTSTHLRPSRSPRSPRSPGHVSPPKAHQAQKKSPSTVSLPSVKPVTADARTSAGAKSPSSLPTSSLPLSAIESRGRRQSVSPLSASDSRQRRPSASPPPLGAGTTAASTPSPRSRNQEVAKPSLTVSPAGRVPIQAEINTKPAAGNEHQWSASPSTSTSGRLFESDDASPHRNLVHGSPSRSRFEGSPSRSRFEGSPSRQLFATPYKMGNDKVGEAASEANEKLWDIESLEDVSSSMRGATRGWQSPRIKQIEKELGALSSGNALQALASRGLVDRTRRVERTLDEIGNRLMSALEGASTASTPMTRSPTAKFGSLNQAGGGDEGYDAWTSEGWDSVSPQKPIWTSEPPAASSSRASPSRNRVTPAPITKEAKAGTGALEMPPQETKEKASVDEGTPERKSLSPQTARPGDQALRVLSARKEYGNQASLLLP